MHTLDRVSTYLLALSLPWAAAARAQPLPITLSLGQPATTVHLRLDNGALVARTATRSARAALAGDATSAVAERVALAGGAVAIVRSEGDGTRAAALVVARRGRPLVLWTGRVDPVGDVGERVADVIRTTAAPTEATRSIEVGRSRDGVRICGQPSTLLDARLLDASSMELRTPPLTPLLSGATSTVARSRSPGPTRAPAVRGLLWTSASNTQDGTAPRALADGDLETVWMGSPGNFANATVSVGRPLRALAIVLPRSLAAVPSQLLIVGEGERLAVTFPAPLARPGATLWVVPPSPLESRCLSLVLSTPGRTPTGLAEVRAYTDLDFGDPAERLVAELEAGGARGSSASRTLGRLGQRGLDAVLGAWGRLNAQARRRAVTVFARQARRAEEAMDALVRAAQDEDEDVSQAAFAALADLGAAAQGALVQLGAESSRAGDRSLVLLMRAAPRAALTLALGALASDTRDLAQLRRVVLTCTRQLGDPGIDMVRAWAEGEPPPEALALAALSLARLPATQALAANLVSRGISQADTFAERWRLVAAARTLPTSDDIDRWIAALIVPESPWMLREAALVALVQRGAPLAPAAAHRARTDPYPRVRVAAIAAIGSSGPAWVLAMSRDDAWPMVRATAIAALASVEQAGPRLRQATGDASAQVRAAAIAALAHRRDRGAATAVGARLRDADEETRVIRAALAYARALCLPQLEGPIRAIALRGMSPQAGVDAAELGPWAIAALATLVGPEGVAEFAQEGTPAAMRRAAEQASRAPRCEHR